MASLRTLNIHQKISLFVHPFIQTVKLYSTEWSEKELMRFLKGNIRNNILSESYRLWQQGANGKLFRLLNDTLRHREKAEYITKKIFENQHLGSHTFETIKQEMLSLGNTKEAFRDSKWKKRWEGIIKSIKKLPKPERKELGTNLGEFFKKEALNGKPVTPVK